MRISGIRFEFDRALQELQAFADALQIVQLVVFSQEYEAPVTERVQIKISFFYATYLLSTNRLDGTFTNPLDNAIEFPRERPLPLRRTVAPDHCTIVGALKLPTDLGVLTTLMDCDVDAIVQQTLQRGSAIRAQMMDAIDSA